MSQLLPRKMRPVLGSVALCALVLGAFSLVRLDESAARKRVAVPIQNATVQPSQVRPIEPPFGPPFPLPRPIPWPTPSVGQSELQLVSQRAQVEIKGATAKTRLVQTFRNPTNSTVEGTYLFPLPAGAAISDFAMTVNGKRMAAEILDRDRARDIYESIVRRLRDPAILEFTDRNAVRARIFPIAAGAQQQVEIEYSQPLTNENGALRYSFPLRLPVGGTAQSASVALRVLDATNLRGVYSPTHSIESKPDGKTLDVSGEWKSGTDESARDFVLYLTQSNARVGLNLVTQKVSGEDGYFMLLAAPDPSLQQKEIAAKDAVFTLDSSGSMEGKKIEQARAALLSLLGNLNPSDRFNIVTFSSDVNTFDEKLVTASPQNIERARAFVRDIKAVGGTNIDEALQTSLKMFTSSTRNGAQQLIFMTDGQPTVGETDIDAILQNARKTNAAFNVDTKKPGVWTEEIQVPRSRVFAFGVGFDVNTKLLDALAEENKGASDYVLPNENIEAKVGALYNKIAFPVLTDAQINWGGANVYDVYPRQLPDLFKGAQTVLFGRFKSASSTRIRLTGNANGQAQSVLADGDFLNSSSDNALLPRLWAIRKIGWLLDDSRRKGVAPVDEVKNEVIALSKKFGIVTPLTAALITEDNPSAPRPIFNGNNSFDASLSAGNIPLSGQMYRSRSGESAVRAAKATDKMKSSTRLDDERAQTPNTRFVEGKTFVLQDEIWTDSAYDAQKMTSPQVVKFASSEYFKLARDAQTAQWLSVGSRVIVVIGNRVLKVEP